MKRLWSIILLSAIVSFITLSTPFIIPGHSGAAAHPIMDPDFDTPCVETDSLLDNCTQPPFPLPDLNGSLPPIDGKTEEILALIFDLVGQGSLPCLLSELRDILIIICQHPDLLPNDNGKRPSAPVPEPGSLLLIGSGLVALASTRRLRKSRNLAADNRRT